MGVIQTVKRNSASKVNVSLSSEMTNGLSTEEKRLLARKKLDQEIGLLSLDGLNMTEITTGVWKENTRQGFSDKNGKTIDNMNTEETRSKFAELAERFRSMTKGCNGVDILMGAECMLIMDPEQRAAEMIKRVMTHATHGIRKLSKKVGELKVDVDDCKDGEAAKAYTQNELKVSEEELEKLKEEYVAIHTWMEDGGPLELLKDENFNELKTFKIMACMQLMWNECDTKVLQVLQALAGTKKFSREIEEALQQPVKSSDAGFEEKFQLNIGANAMVKKMRTGCQTNTVHGYMAKAAELEQIEFNFAELKTNPFASQLNNIKDKSDSAQWILDALREEDPDGATNGLGGGRHIFWLVLSKIGGRGLNNNSTIGHENYSLIKDKLMRIHETLVESGDTLESRWIQLQKMLKSIDATCGENYKDKGRAQFNLNTNMRGQMQRQVSQGKGKGKGKGNGLCIGVLRKGQCSRPGCTYSAMTKEEYNGREMCRNMENTGQCRFGAQCKNRHPGDPSKLTEELMKGCVHHKGNINSASEIGDGAAAEKEEGAVTE